MKHLIIIGLLISLNSNAKVTVEVVDTTRRIEIGAVVDCNVAWETDLLGMYKESENDCVKVDAWIDDDEQEAVCNQFFDLFDNPSARAKDCQNRELLSDDQVTACEYIDDLTACEF